MLVKRNKWNNKGMSANLIRAFIVILIGWTLIPVISQEINNALDCSNIKSNNTISANITYESPPGATDSFGGGGSDHFGGYTGEVRHKDWLSQQAFYQTNETFIIPKGNLCQDGNVPEFSATLLGFVPIFFILTIALAAFMIVYNSLNSAGIM